MEAALSLPYDTRLLLSWLCAALLAVGVRYGTKTSWPRAIGIGIMTVPLWLTAWAYVNSIQRLADSGSVLPTYSTWTLSAIWSRSVLVDLGYIGTGFLLAATEGRWRWLEAHGLAGLATKAREMGLPLGGRSEGASLLWGLLVFPAFILVTWVVNALVYAQPALVNGDETSVWDNMTPYHAIFISLAAGIGEELVYRGVLLVGLLHLLRRMEPRARVTLAVGIQALVFGFAHAGYGTWAHVIVPTLFGLVAGAIAMRYGIWAAILIHVLVDVYAFGLYAAQNAAWFWTLLLVLFFGNLALTFAWSMRWTYRRFIARPM